MITTLSGSSLRDLLQSPVSSTLWSPIASSATCSRTPSPSLFPYCKRPTCTPIQNNRQDYGFVYSNLYLLRQQTGRQQILDRLVAERLYWLKSIVVILSLSGNCWYNNSN
jgi:hypothetical protein